MGIRFEQGEELTVKQVGERLKKKIPSKNVSTNTKKSWLNELSYYCEWSSKGERKWFRIVIGKVKDVTDADVARMRKADDGRGEKGVYIDHVESILMEYIKDNEYFRGNILNLWVDKLEFLTKFVSTTFRTDIPVERCKTEYCKDVYRTVQDRTLSALGRIQAKGYANYSYEDYVVYKRGNEECISLDEDKMKCFREAKEYVEETTGIIPRECFHIKEKRDIYMREVVKYLNEIEEDVFQHEVMTYKKVLTIFREKDFPKNTIFNADVDRVILERLFHTKWSRHCSNIGYGDKSVLEQCFSKAFVHRFATLEEAQQRGVLILELEQKLKTATHELQWLYGTIEEVEKLYGEWRKLTGVGYKWTEEVLIMKIIEREEDKEGAEREAVRNKIEKEWNAKMLSRTEPRTDIYHYWGIIRSSDDNFKEYEEFTEEEMDEYYM
jgi:hypothetical protein